jgi:hypothetical protein
MSKDFFIPYFGSGYVWKWKNIPQTVRKKHTTFITERIVALRSVNNIFPESYGFAATNNQDQGQSNWGPNYENDKNRIFGGFVLNKSL